VKNGTGRRISQQRDKDAAHDRHCDAFIDLREAQPDGEANGEENGDPGPSIQERPERLDDRPRQRQRRQAASGRRREQHDLDHQRHTTGNTRTTAFSLGGAVSMALVARRVSRAAPEPRRAYGADLAETYMTGVLSSVEMICETRIGSPWAITSSGA
jgi:hypothetical protein